MARRILLADDSVTAQNMGRRILTDAGYEVLTVNNGSAALKKIAEHKPDIIVLDVYMPGYGGLEVCQRVKENPETKPIPVLLTVGKLEPFKAEEARRVGADAFIIKPFEATELLTVLTKLEDKIVAQPQPQKSGRFARALAAVEQSDTRERFGDKETGWKNRLTIPSPNVQPRAEEVSEPVAVTPRDPDAVKPVEPAQGFERPIPTGLPADITPEEIAAITAAAAVFGGNTESAPAIPENVVAEIQQEAPAPAAVAEPEAEPVATPAVSAPEASSIQADAPVEPVAEAVAISEVTKEPEASRVEVEEVRVEEPVVSSEPSTPAPTAETPIGSEAASCRSAAFCDRRRGSHGRACFLAPHGSNGTGYDIAASVRSFAVAIEAASGPRWIAESVEVALEESKLALDLEMEHAHAARASAEAATVSSVTDAVSAIAVAAPQPEAVVAAEVGVAEAAIVTELVAPSAAEVSVAGSAGVEAVANQVVVEPASVESVSVEPVSNQAASEQEQPLAVVAEESAYAAAAAAGAGAERSAPAEVVSVSTETPQNNATAQVPSAPHREAELAAAWQNWKQIRESFVSAQPPAAGTEASAETKSDGEEASAPAQSAAEAVVAETAEIEASASDAPEESTAIASIVDTMLAELRPKLVAEIAKKMNSEKKEKDKKRKK